MISTYSNYTPDNKSLSSLEGRIDNKNKIFASISSNLQDSNIYIPLQEGKKFSSKKGWNQKRNLVEGTKAKSHIESGGNIGLILGKWFNNTTYVLFDIEEEGILPPDLKSVVDSHTVLKQRSPHGGLNRIVRIEEKEAYELLDSFNTTYTDIREGPQEDLELMTNGGTPLSPSEIEHSNCSTEKRDYKGSETYCNQLGTDKYTTVSINPEAPNLDLEAVRLIGDILGEEGGTQLEQPYYTEEVDSNVPSPRPTFNIEKEFKQNVPSVKQSFNERMEYMRFGDWEGRELFNQLWEGDFKNIPGSNKQGKAECKLANYIGFFFGNNEKFVRLFMDMVEFESHYQKYDSHRKYLLENATSVDWCYCEGVSFAKKYETACEIWINDSIRTKELIENVSVEKDAVYRILKVLKAENMIQKDGDMIKNQRITEGYLNRLYNTHEKYEDNEEGNL